MSSFGQLLLKRHIVINAMRVSLLVGTLLNFINQGSALIDGVGVVWGQVLLNFVVPYCVASYSAVKNEMERTNNNE
jgi:hypothetical protein